MTKKPYGQYVVGIKVGEAGFIILGSFFGLGALGAGAGVLVAGLSSWPLLWEAFLAELRSGWP